MRHSVTLPMVAASALVRIAIALGSLVPTTQIIAREPTTVDPRIDPGESIGSAEVCRFKSQLSG